MNVELGWLVGVVGTCIGAVLGIAGYIKGTKKEVKEESREDGALKADTEYIKRRIDDVLLEQRNSNITLGIHAERITRVEESAKQAHLRITELREEIGKDG